MANDSSATVRETPHADQTTRTNTIVNALIQRARAVLNDKSIDSQSRAIIRYAMEVNDPWLAELVRRADARVAIVGTLDFTETPPGFDADASDQKIKVLADIICQASEKTSAALFVLMATLEKSTHPKLLANAAKHLAFAHCAQLPAFGIVDAQLAVVEAELLADDLVK